MGLKSYDKHYDNLPQGLPSFLSLIVLLYIILIDLNP
jgi:hypothetical protein